MGEKYNEKGQKVYETSRGDILVLKGVSPLFIAKLQSAGTIPPVPTRKIKLELDGLEDTYQEEELSEGDLQDADEERRWKEYAEERDAVLLKRNTNFMKAIFAKGVEVDLSHLEEWKQDQEYYGLEIPSHPTDLKVEYIQTELVTNTDDMIGIITGVLGESGIPEEELASVRAMFRSSIRRGSPGETESTEGEVDVEPELYGDESSALLEGVAP